MHCPHSYLHLSRFLHVLIHTDGDYYSKKQIKRKEWLNIKRYDFHFFPGTKYSFRLCRKIYKNNMWA